MKVIRAKSAGFCSGVRRALGILDREVGRGGDVFTFGPIIHNPLVIRHYEKQGAIAIESPESAGYGDCVVIRAHGLPRDVEAALRARGAVLRDATCPKVKKAQLGIEAQCRNGRSLLLFGEPGHAEVRGLLSYADETALAFSNIEELESLIQSGAVSLAREYFLSVQTTQERSLFEQIKNRLFVLLGPDIPVLDTICDATSRRQDELAQICLEADLAVIVGGRNSGNTKRLVDVANHAGVRAIHVEAPCELAELPPDAFKAVKVVALSAGASTPGEHINQAEEFLLSL